MSGRFMADFYRSAVKHVVEEKKNNNNDILKLWVRTNGFVRGKYYTINIYKDNIFIPFSSN